MQRLASVSAVAALSLAWRCRRLAALSCRAFRCLALPLSSSIFSKFQGHGFHLVVYPSDVPAANCAPSDVVIVTNGMLQDCVRFTAKDGNADYPAAVAALQYVLAHELAHLFLKHGVSI